MKKNIKNSVVTLAMATVLSLTAICGFGTSAKAANTTDTWYAFNSGNVSGYSSIRQKDNTSKVYIHPVSGPKIYYKVEGITTNGSAFTASSTHAIQNGVKASITNHVIEWGGVSARLYMQRITSVNQDTRGVWSPDSANTYTVYN